jgi:hypothetical protein
MRTYRLCPQGILECFEEAPKAPEPLDSVTDGAPAAPIPSFDSQQGRSRGPVQL